MEQDQQKQQISQMPDAVISEGGSGFSAIWLLPIAAVVIGLWLVYRTFAEQGVMVTIRFNNAEGIEVKKTQIKYKDVTIGVVNDLQFSDNLTEVVAVAEINPQAIDLLTDESRFWVVRPRIEGLSVSGINTLLSGSYIAMDPGKGEDTEREFIGLEEPPSLLSDVRGTTYRLRAEKLGSITKGAPLYYRDIVVGEVTNYQLAPDHSHVALDVFIRMPHDLYVNKQSRFWNVSGIDLKLDAQGVGMNVQSLASLLSGGISFSTPANAPPADIAPENSEFVLYDSEEHSHQKTINLTISYQLYFEDSVRGLTVGAPVEFRGIRVGTVQDVHLEEGRKDFRIVVTIGISPERLVRQGQVISNLEELMTTNISYLVENGMRAQLKSGNLLTGQLFVDLDIHQNVPDAKLDEIAGYPVIPTIPSTISGITRSITSLLAKLERLPIDQVGQDLQEITKGASKLVNDEGLMKTVREFNASIKAANQLLGTLNNHADPMLKNVESATDDLRKLLKTTTKVSNMANRVFKNIDQLTAADSIFINDLTETLNEFAAAARSVKTMMEYLERHPEALLQGKKR